MSYLVSPNNHLLNPGEFPADVFPDRLKRLADEVCTVRGVPVILPACACVAIVSASIGPGLAVRSGGDRRTMGNLYIMITARTGVGKSTGTEPAIRPFRQHQDLLRIRWGTQEERDTKSPGRESPIEIRPARKQGKGPRDHPPTLITEDTTGPALEMVLAGNNETTFSYSTEADWISRRDSQRERLYLKAFTLEHFASESVSRGAVQLERPCITAFWLTQPHRVEQWLKDRNLEAGGLLGRMLIAHSEARMTVIGEQGTRGIDLTVQSEYDVLIDQLLCSYRHLREPLEVQPTDEVLEIMRRFHNEMVERWNECASEKAQDLMVRWPELAWKISLVFHAATHGAEAHLHPLEEGTAVNAIRLVRWFGDQALGILGQSRQHDDRLRRILQILQNAPDRQVSRRDLHNSHGFLDGELDGLLARFPEQIGMVELRKSRTGRSSPGIKLISPVG